MILCRSCMKTRVNELCSFTQQVCAEGSTNLGGLAASDGRSMTTRVGENHSDRGNVE